MAFSPLVESSLVGPPDWFLSGVVSTSTFNRTVDGGFFLIAFSSKPYVHIFSITFPDLSNLTTHQLSYIGQIQPHHERIASISFCPTADPCSTLVPKLFTCGHDGLVRHWVYQQDWLLEEELNVRELGDSLLPVCMSPVCVQEVILVFVGTNKGNLIVWSTGRGNSNVTAKQFENESPLCCQWESLHCPSFSFRVAVGYKKGIVGVYRYESSSLTSKSSLIQLSRFYAHEKDVCHVIWRPPAPDGHSASLSDLVTSGRDQLIKLWDSNQSSCVSSAWIRGSGRSTNKDTERSADSKKQSTGAPWISVCWIPSPTIDIIISGLRGELYTWCGFEEPVKLNPPASQEHSMLIFAMSHVSQSPGLFTTASQDRQVMLWQKSEQKLVTCISSIPIINSGVCALAQPDHGHGPLAVGVSDGSISLWRYTDSSQSERRDQLRTVWPRGMHGSSVTALAWHPSDRHETLLAYGTESGCVDLIDCAKLSKSQNLKSKTQPYLIGSTVYRVAWGPWLFSEQTTSNGNADDTEKGSEKTKTPKKFSFYVYSVCKGKLFCHTGFQRPPIDVSTKFPIPPGVDKNLWLSDKRTDICFLYPNKLKSVSDDSPTSLLGKTFTSLVAVGLRSGSVDLYILPKLQSDSQEPCKVQFVCRITCHAKGINSLSWSFFNYWLAIGSNESHISVVDVKDAIKQTLETSGSTSLTSCLARLEGHSNRITCLDWSPHDSTLLLSASFDGTANVWKITETDPPCSIANFRAHRLRLFACLWSRQECDLALTGGELSQLFCWRPSKLVHKEPPNCRRYRPPPIKRSTPGESPSELAAAPKSIDTTIDSTQPVTELSVALEDDAIEKQPVPSLKASSTKKPSGDKRKRPALCPHFLRRPTTEPSTIDTKYTPPIIPGSKLLQVLHVIDWVKNSTPIPVADRDLLFLLPERGMTHGVFIRFIQDEAQYHLDAYRSASKPNGLPHLDAFCMLQLWLGRGALVAQVMKAEAHLPFWLMWALQLSQTAVPAFCFNEQSADLLGEKIKEMTASNPDVLLSSTLLVCAGRTLEAIDLLIGNDKIREALLLTRLRLQPDEANLIIEKCLNRLIERRLVHEIPFFTTIRLLGDMNTWEQAYAAIVPVACGSSFRGELEQLALRWVEWNILSVHCVENPPICTGAFLRLASNVLLVGFSQTDLPILEYLEQWRITFTTYDRHCPGVNCFHLLLAVAIHFSSILQGDMSLSMDMEQHLAACKPPELINLFCDFVRDRQASCEWAPCLVQLVYDLAACLLLDLDPDASTRQSSDDRLIETLRRCKNANPKRITQLIGGLILTLSRNLCTIHSPVVSILSSVLTADTSTLAPSNPL